MPKKDDNVTKLPALQRWIDDKGRVDYYSLKNNEWLWKQLQAIETANLEGLSHKEEFAFWLNAYNFLTIRGVLLELERNPNWQGNLSLFDRIKFFYFRKFKAANRKISLYYLENTILRKRFKDPRIHFAINCGSTSCPYLPGQLFKAETLEKVLDGLTSFFINVQTNVFFEERTQTLYLNKIFKWYKRDFQKTGGVIDFIKRYWKGPVEKLEKAKIRHKKYNWSLNTQIGE